MTNFAYRAPDKTFWFGGEGGLWHMVNGRLTRIELPQAMAEQSDVSSSNNYPGSIGRNVGVIRNRGLYRLNDGVWTKYGGRSDLPKSECA